MADDREIFCTNWIAKEVKKETKPYKRGLLDVLDIHACIGSEVGAPRKNTSMSSRDARPYAPSLKSMPSSSLSEGSECNLVEKSISIEKPRKKAHKKRKGKETIKVENAVDKYKDSGNYYRHKVSREYATYACCDSYPIRDKQNKEIYQFSDILPEYSNESLLNNNFSGITEHETLDSMPQLEGGYRTVAYSTEKKNNGNQYLKAENLDEDSTSLGNIKSKNYKPVCNETKDLRKIKTKNINEIYTDIKDGASVRGKLKNNGTAGKNLNVCSNNKILRLFDCNKYPLTDNDGNILKAANGQDLVILRNDKPLYDCFKRLLYDENEQPSDSAMFNPYSLMKENTERLTHLTLFDFRGYPLTDHNGASLTNIHGEKLVVADKNGKLLHDINGNPLYDEAGIPLTKKENCWLNPRGSPYRVFDKLTYPLTNKCGETLHNKYHEKLLKCDEYGRPVIAYNGEVVFDAVGCLATDPKFNPTTPSENDDNNIIIHIGNSPAQVYDRNNFPLTDSNGEVLKDAKGKLRINIDDNYINLPAREKNNIISCTLKVLENEYILSPPSKENLQGKLGKNETRRASLNELRNIDDFQFDFKPLLDNNGDYVYDSQGQVVISSPNIFPELEKTVTNSVNLIESAVSKNAEIPRLLQDLNSQTSLIYEKKSYISAINLSEVSNIDFDSETDIFGRPLYDQNGFPLFDKYGRPTKDLFLRPLYDSIGRPISSADGKLLSDGSEEMPGVNPNFDINYLKLHDPEKTLQATDHHGGPVHDYLGRPMYNIYGKPIRDAFGRPLYDTNGHPLCDEKGLPASKVIKEKGLRIENVEDKLQILTVFQEENKKIIHEGPNSRNLRRHSQKLDAVEICNAKVRLTTFENGEKVMELLEIVPNNTVL